MQLTINAFFSSSPNQRTADVRLRKTQHTPGPPWESQHVLHSLRMSSCFFWGGLVRTQCVITTRHAFTSDRNTDGMCWLFGKKTHRPVVLSVVCHQAKFRVILLVSTVPNRIVHHQRPLPASPSSLWSKKPLQMAAVSHLENVSVNRG